ncbi:MAG: TetR/AcrR family transcriptional regulator [Myxococcaceae bacterium]
MAKVRLKAVDEDALLDTAARLFRQRGFAASTLREIAQAAGMLPGSIHYRYPAKEDLLVALMDRAVVRAIAAVESAAARSTDPTERVRLALRAHLELLLSGDDGVYVLLYEWRALAGRAREEIVHLRDRYEAFWDGMLYAAAGAGRLRPGVDLKLLRLFGFGAVNWVATWYSPEGGSTPEKIADAFWAYLTLGLLAEAPRRERATLRESPK